MIRMLIVGYVFAIRSERLICREVAIERAELSGTLTEFVWHYTKATRQLSLWLR
jgi:hypothetical protein